MNAMAKQAIEKVVGLFESTHWTSGYMESTRWDVATEREKKVFCAIGGLRHVLDFNPTERPGNEYIDRDREWAEWDELLAYRDALYTLVEVIALRDDDIGIRAHDSLRRARPAAFDMSSPGDVLSAFDDLEDIVVDFNDGDEFGGKDGVIALFKEALTKEFPAATAS